MENNEYGPVILTGDRTEPVKVLGIEYITEGVYTIKFNQSLGGLSPVHAIEKGLNDHVATLKRPVYIIDLSAAVVSGKVAGQIIISGLNEPQLAGCRGMGLYLNRGVYAVVSACSSTGLVLMDCGDIEPEELRGKVTIKSRMSCPTT